jgi:hypothetical protein
VFLLTDQTHPTNQTYPTHMTRPALHLPDRVMQMARSGSYDW